MDEKDRELPPIEGELTEEILKQVAGGQSTTNVTGVCFPHPGSGQSHFGQGHPGQGHPGQGDHRR